MIALRNAMLVPNKLSAKSYIQDSAFFMLDGIENAGWGVHNPNYFGDASDKYRPTSQYQGWRNLRFESSGQRIDYNAFAPSSVQPSELYDGGTYAVFGDWDVDGFVFSKFTSGGPVVNNYGYWYPITADSWTCEQVFTQVATRHHHVLAEVSFWDNVLYYPYDENGQHKSATVPGLSLPNIVNQPCYFALTYSADASRLSAYCDGELYFSSVLSIPMGRSNYVIYVFDPWDVGSKLFALRDHSRALTAAEIDANYAVDKARFGLP